MADALVVDASVVAKWFLKDELETDTELADQLLIALLGGDAELHAPNTLRYEMGAANQSLSGARAVIGQATTSKG